MEKQRNESSPTIALVANTSWSIYNFRLPLIHCLQQQGYTVMVIAPKDNFSAALISAGVSYHPLYLDNYGTNPLGEISIIKQLYKIYKEQSIDFIFHYTIKPNIYGSIAAKMAGTPSVAVTTGLGHLLSFSNWLTRVVSLSLYKLGASLSKEVWFLNEVDREDFLKLRILSEKKTYLLPGEGVDVSHFSPLGPKENGASMRLLFAGRIIWDKGFREFIEAAKIIKQRYPYVEFNVVGFVDPINPNAVPYEYILKHQETGLIKYFGETSDIRPYLQQAHCLVFPSYYREGVSRILLEAAAMKTPIITTRNVGCESLVDNEITGFLVPKKDVNSLVDAIETFINLPYQQRLDMGEMARIKIVKDHAQDKIHQHYVSKLNDFGILPSKTRSISAHSLSK